MFRVALVTALVLVAGCAGPAAPVSTPTVATVATPTATTPTATTSTPAVTPTTGSGGVAIGEGFRLSVDGTDTSWAPVENDCTDRVHLVATAGGDYQVALIDAACTPNPVAGNGFHGYFTDPPAEAVVERFTTPAGEARLFANSYFECTNSCTTGTDQVGLLAVDGTLLQVIALASPSGAYQDRTRDELKAFLATLRRD